MISSCNPPGPPAQPHLQTNSALYGTPTFNPSATATWPADTTSFANPTPTSVRADHPRLIAPAYKWQALPDLVSKDAYLSNWNDTIFGNATALLNEDPLIYLIDGGLGGSGVLDIARQTKMRIKSLAYAYRMSNQTQFADRAWRELQVWPNVRCPQTYLTTSVVCRMLLEIRVTHSEIRETTGIRSISSTSPNLRPPLLSAMTGSTITGRRLSANKSNTPSSVSDSSGESKVIPTLRFGSHGGDFLETTTGTGTVFAIPA